VINRKIFSKSGPRIRAWEPQAPHSLGTLKPYLILAPTNPPNKLPFPLILPHDKLGELVRLVHNTSIELNVSSRTKVLKRAF